MRKFITLLVILLMVSNYVNVRAFSNELVNQQVTVYDVDDLNMDVEIAESYYNTGVQLLTELSLAKSGPVHVSEEISNDLDYIPPATIIYEISINGLGSYKQDLGSWSANNMESCDESIGISGCAVASFANILNKYQYNDNPGSVNSNLESHACPFDYSYSATYYDMVYQNIFHSYYTSTDKTFGQALPTLLGILQHGRAPMIGLRKGSNTHFVVVSGYKEYSDGGVILEIIDSLESPVYTNLLAYFNAGYKIHRIKVFYA